MVRPDHLCELIDMQVVHRDEAKMHKNSETCFAVEYTTRDTDINGAVIELTGRYPMEGRVVNKKCKEVAYILKGFGKIVIEGVENVLNDGDLVFIEPGERYFWEGDLSMFVSCAPAWYPEQHEEVV